MEQRYKVIDFNGDDHTTDLSRDEAEEIAADLSKTFNEDYEVIQCFERENQERRNKEQPWRNRGFNSNDADGWEDLYPEY